MPDVNDPRGRRQSDVISLATGATVVGLAFAGLSANSPFYNVTTTVAMLLGRFGLAIPALILAGRFALQPAREPGQGAIRTDTLLFGIIVVATALIVVALTYLPAVALGPIIEHLTMLGR